MKCCVSLKSLTRTVTSPVVTICREVVEPSASVMRISSGPLVVARLCLFTKSSEMKSCVDPESISIVARRPFTLPWTILPVLPSWVPVDPLVPLARDR